MTEKKITEKKKSGFKRKVTPPPAKVSGPRIPGAESKPSIPEVRPSKMKPRKRTNHTATDPIEIADNYTKGKNGHYSRQHFQKKMKQLKAMIEPITPSLIQVCSDIAHDPKVHPAVRLDAATRLLDRAWGKPKEHVTVSDERDDSSTDEVFKLLNNILESAGAPLLEAPEKTNDADLDSEAP